MNILDVLSGNYIGIVKKYIDKIFQNEAVLFNHSENDFDIILRKVNGNNLKIKKNFSSSTSKM